MKLLHRVLIFRRDVEMELMFQISLDYMLTGLILSIQKHRLNGNNFLGVVFLVTCDSRWSRGVQDFATKATVMLVDYA